MNGRIGFVAIAQSPACCHCAAHAQDVPGIEICTVEKTMERRTSCLQSNVDFLQKTITKLALDNQRRVDAANRQIDALEGDGGVAGETRRGTEEGDRGRQEGRHTGEGCRTGGKRRREVAARSRTVTPPGSAP